ncbi:hypothetical protein ACFL26_02090 [Patescibacteria group bacterium]
MEPPDDERRHPVKQLGRQPRLVRVAYPKTADLEAGGAEQGLALQVALEPVGAYLQQQRALVF